MRFELNTILLKLSSPNPFDRYPTATPPLPHQP